VFINVINVINKHVKIFINIINVINYINKHVM